MLNKLKKILNQKNNYPKIIIGSFLIFFLFIFFIPKIVRAVSSVYGAAWWGDDLKFIYFNCNDYESGSRFDSPENFQDMPEPRGFHFYIAGCVIDHGVQIDNNGIFFGSAFNYAKGMINFGGSSTPVSITEEQRDSFKDYCLYPDSCTAGTYCSACYNSNDQRIYGFAQVSSSKELIHLNVNLASGPPTENDLQLKSWNLASSTYPYYSTLESGDFLGHASSTVSGTHQSLSFNCLSEYGDESLALCNEDGKENYKVYIKNPEVGRMTAPNWSFSDACNCSPNCSPGSVKKAVLRWELKSGIHAAYEVVVTTADTLATSSPETVCYSGVQISSALQYTIPNVNDELCKTSASLEYNTSYYWFVRLYYLEDSIYKATEWYQFGVNDGHDGELYDDNNGPINPLLTTEENKKVFTTYKHEFPTPYFTWSPEEVLVGATTTIFTSLTPGQKSQYYNEFNPSSPIDCDEEGNCLYLWSVTGNFPEIENESLATTTISFFEQGSAIVNLRVEDPSAYYCIASRQITNINYGLPLWREVKAE